MSALATQIARFIADEKFTGRKVEQATDIPNNYGELTTQWLEAVLNPAQPSGSIASFSLGAPDDGSSNRRKITINYSVDRTQQAPTAVFCKAAETAASRTVLAEFGSSETEAKFYSKVRDRLTIPTPKCYFAGYNPQNYAYFLMLEDLSSRAIFPDQSRKLTLAEAKAMTASLARFHAQFYEDAELGTDSLPFPTWPQWWQKLNEDTPAFAAYCQDAFEQARDLMPASLVGRGEHVWQHTLDSVALHDRLPKTLLHCDVHLKNWFITTDGELGLHDWQLVTVGHWSRDFVYAIVTSLTVEQRRSWYDDLLRQYLAELQARCSDTASFADAHRWCRQQLLSVLSFWTITLNPAPEMPDMQPRETIEAFLTRIFYAIDDMDCLAAFD